MDRNSFGISEPFGLSKSFNIWTVLIEQRGLVAQRGASEKAFYVNALRSESICRNRFRKPHAERVSSTKEVRGARGSKGRHEVHVKNIAQDFTSQKISRKTYQKITRKICHFGRAPFQQLEPSVVAEATEEPVIEVEGC